MNTTYIPTPIDTALQVESAVTKTATYNGASLDLGSGFAPGGSGIPMAAVIIPTARDFTTTDETYTATVQESDDNSTFTDASPAVSILAVAALSVPALIHKRYVRCKLTLAGTTPSITYSAWFTPLVTPST